MADIQSFVSQYGPVASKVAGELGVTPDIILGQWGLETGWGKSVIPGTNNLGNIKDFSGKGVAATDNMTGSRDKYRAYADPSDFANDFSSLIGRKYPGAMGAGSDASKYASALKAGGYAEDPAYASKVSGAAGMVRKLGEFFANAVSGIAQAAELPPANQAKLANDPLWQMLNGAPAIAEPQVSEKLANDPTWQLLNSAPSTTETKPTTQPQKASIVSQAGHQLGLTARAAGHGIADAVDLLGVPINGAINWATGSSLPAPGDMIRSGVDAVTPAPVGNFEKGVQTAASAVGNPLNLLGGEAIVAAKGLGQLVNRSGMLGAMAGGISPSQDPRGDSIGQLVARAGEGYVGGAVLGPLAKYAGDAFGAGVNKLKQATNPVTPEAAASVADNALMRLANQGIDTAQVPPDVLATIRQQVQAAALKGQTLDPAALLRQQDFNAAGVTPTLGQLTRDPMQFAQERNLRGIDLGGGQNPIATRLNEQPNQLLQRMNELGASGAQDAYPAGNLLIQRLQAADAPAKAGVDAAYNAARDTAGRYANLDVPAFSNAANDALDSQMLGRFLPTNVRGLLNDVSSGKIPLNVNTAVQIDSVMSQAQRAAQASGDAAGVKAIGTVRDALNNAPIASNVGAESKAAFDSARTQAAARFKTIKDTPALEAALNDAKPDNFVNKYIIGGDVKSLQSLRKVVADDPQAIGIIRAQIADYLKSKAFGANTAGDANIGQSSFNNALNKMGRDKLLTFFSPEEVNQFFASGRVAAYINAQPAGSSVNNSGTGSALINLLTSIKEGALKLPGIQSIDAGVSNFKQTKGIQNALEARVAPNVTRVKGRNELLRLTAPGADSIVEQRQ